MSLEQPHEFEFVEKAKIRTRDLRVGMFLCELDRPWCETSFARGFEIKSAREIEALRLSCDYVYIDILRSRLEDVSLSAPPSPSFTPKDKASFFSKEFEVAATTLKQTSDLMNSFAADIRFGSSIDIQMARESVSECVSTVMRNPDALLLMSRMSEKSELVGQHAMNTAVYSVIIGRMADLSGKELEDLGACGLLHDIGILSIPEVILNKTGALTEDEKEVVRQHTKIGADILASGHSVSDSAIEVAYSHHEHLDGTGYPRALHKRQLSRSCRIVAVVEKYDAIVTPRPHRPAFTHLDALNILNEMARQNQLDSRVVNGFITHMGIYPPGSIVELTSGEKAIVLENNPDQRMRPRVLMVRDRDNNPIARLVNLASKATDDRGQPYRIKTIHSPGAFGINLLDYRTVVAKSLA
jgi:HD-GYP domain-containing protein (c-di-GMP phosphodiesterase class II)